MTQYATIKSKQKIPYLNCYKTWQTWTTVDQVTNNDFPHSAPFTANFSSLFLLQIQVTVLTCSKCCTVFWYMYKGCCVVIFCDSICTGSVGQHVTHIFVIYIVDFDLYTNRYRSVSLISILAWEHTQHHGCMVHVFTCSGSRIHRELSWIRNDFPRKTGFSKRAKRRASQHVLETLWALDCYGLANLGGPYCTGPGILRLKHFLRLSNSRSLYPSPPLLQMETSHGRLGLQIWVGQYARSSWTPVLGRLAPICYSLVLIHRNLANLGNPEESHWPTGKCCERLANYEMSLEDLYPPEAMTFVTYST